MNDYIYQTDRLFFKHEITENLQKDAYSPHIHNGYELIYFVRGNATHVIEDRKYKLKPGDLILIRPLQYHFIQIDEASDYERYDFLFDPEKHRVEGVDLIPRETEVLRLEENSLAEDVFRRCDLYRKNCEGEEFDRILSHLLSELFFNLHLFPGAPAEESAGPSPILSEALQYINEHLCTLTDVDEIATRLFTSKSYLFRLFKKELHQTPKKYVQKKRLLLAEKMLSEGTRPTQVCEKCGFADYTTFFRNYKHFFGRSPSRPSAEDR